eukprot:g60609.t1
MLTSVPAVPVKLEQGQQVKERKVDSFSWGCQAGHARQVETARLAEVCIDIIMMAAMILSDRLGEPRSQNRENITATLAFRLVRNLRVRK